MLRELPKLPELPDGFGRCIDDMTQICFLPAEMRPVDVVFVFGNWTQRPQIARHIEALFRQGVCRRFILTGGLPSFDYAHLEQVPVADAVYAALPDEMRSVCNIDCNNRSLNSVEDVAFAETFLAPYSAASIGCVACSWAMGRQINYLKKYRAQAEIFPMPYDSILENGQSLTRENWSNHLFTQKLIWGEITRIKLYGERGDMAYAASLKQQIDSVFEKVRP